MSHLCTCHVPTIRVLFSPGRQRPGLTEALERHSADLVVPTSTELGGQQ